MGVSSEQMVAALPQAAAGTPVADVCRMLEITETTFCRCERELGELGATELRESKQLRHEDTKQKQLAAQLSRGNTILREALKRKR